ncbi:3-hydroxymethyl-3-methylglutaryl-Coenzyme A lyase [Talaromyces stipitatus ATCC 10500]|uniref:hydroxymethylglutaryl-CoA lyase n=1 Tax=Talaromyces stipitatus (strain ATCC 10500 / CBS 375.48 / QM 6759 / NRRL 1006) TaxID=441959 RepID=B8MNJ0_TALSN|nr:3-hydroxymethyl-3-methylglutaryl-Coenzyme A lyase [Talaromyces stipitatus ATCC 10500]EED14079.1 3-hydroxymethyl-3-methylglutaryl-Coenzyme A lyase [Talaromyces stipitatus ATCC 10500]
MTRQIPEVRIVEVGPRDGLQSIQDTVPTETKIELIQRLRQAGLRSIELTSVVSPRKIPQLADCQEVLANPAIKRLIEDPEKLGLQLPVLTPNLKGLEIALSRGVKEVAVFISATERFSQANINCSIEGGLERARAVARKAIQAGVAVRGYVSCVFVDPYDGPTNPSSVLHCVQELLQIGCYEVSLGDTTGAGTPAKVATLLRYLEKNSIPLKRLAGHFHDTYGQAVANVLQAYICGIRVFDASVGGLGGCPFAPGAKGNVSTEDVVLMFQNAGIQTGVNLTELIATGDWINQQVRGSSDTLPSDYCIEMVDMPHYKQPQWREKDLHLSSFRPMTYMKASIRRVKHADKIRIFQLGNGDLKIVLNRPNRENMLTRSMITAMIECLKTCHNDSSISRIVITGTGPYFCAGVDTKRESFEDNNPGTTAAHDLLIQLFGIIDQYPKSVIACLNGHACGAGVALAFACDERIMMRTATINLNPTKETNILTDLVNRYFPSTATKQDDKKEKWHRTLSSRPINGPELQLLGLVTEIAENKKDMQMKLENCLCVKDNISSGRTFGSLTKL